jgi:hypothetical protein
MEGGEAIGCKMREVSPNFIYSHIFWVTLVKQDETADVVNVELLSFEAEVLKTDRSPDLIEQAWRLRLRPDRCWIIPLSGVLSSKSDG